MKLAVLLANHVASADLGVVFAAETGFILSRDPDTVRAPDVAYMAKPRLAQMKDESAYIPFAPDVAVEAISPSDTFSAVEEDAFAWLEAGVRLVLPVDPETRRVHAYRSPDFVSVLGADGHLDANDVVPGWQLNVSDVFD